MLSSVCGCGAQAETFTVRITAPAKAITLFIPDLHSLRFDPSSKVRLLPKGKKLATFRPIHLYRETPQINDSFALVAPLRLSAMANAVDNPYLPNLPVREGTARASASRTRSR